MNRFLKPVFAAFLVGAFAAVLCAQVFLGSEPFRSHDSVSVIRAKLVQSGVTVAGLATVAPASHGTVTLTNGAAIVSNTLVDGGSEIFLTKQNLGSGAATNSVVSISGRTNGVNFKIQSTVATDGSAVAWWIVNP